MSSTLRVLALLVTVVCVCATPGSGATRLRKAIHRQAGPPTAAEIQRQVQQLQIALQLPPGTQIFQGSNPPPAQPGMVWIQIPTQGSYPQQPGGFPQQPGYPQQPQQPGNYPGSYPQKPPQQPGNYPQQPQQPGNYPGSVPQQPPPPPPPTQVGGDTLQPSYPFPSYPAPVPPYPGNQPLAPDFENPANEPVDNVSEETPGLAPGQETGSEPPSPLLQYCKEPRGQFPSESACNTFINCWDDTVFELPCPGGLHFNAETKVCDYPENVDCGNRGGDVAEGSGETTPSTCPSPYATYRSSTSCGIFYMCVAGTPFEFACPEGLNYNTDLGVCDYPYNVDCKGISSERPIPATPELPPPEENTGGGEYVPDQTQTDGGQTYYGGLKKVPANLVDSRVPCRSNEVFRLNPSCTSVSLCRRGYSTVINCAAGTAWDSNAQQCINVYQARC